MAIRMYNVEIEQFANFLLGLNLKGKESRMRTRFIKTLQERMALVKEEHLDLIKQYSEKDENGEPKIIEKDGQQVYDVQDMEAFNKEYNELMLEELVVEETVANKDVLNAVRNAVLNCDQEFSGQDALVFDRFCEIVEGEE